MCFSFGFALSVWAQDRVVSGKVVSKEDNTPLPGVNVVIKGTTSGTVTDAEGKYTLSVPAGGGALLFSFIGLKTEDIEIGDRSVVDIALGLDVTQLSEVVVTALNIKQEVKTLSYATQQINADKLTMARANNITDALAGKVAGVQIRSQAGSKLGSNTDIRIRGAGSLNDGNPLYVLDGTPIANPIDINNDDIESVNVLKGPQAVALYGQRGEYGVIQLTSKRAKKGALGIEITNSTMADKVYILPHYQNSYAGGVFSDLQKFTYQPGMPTDWQPLDGKYYPDYEDDSSWGPRMVGQEYIPWYAWAPGSKYSGQTAKLTPQPNNVRDFYGTAVNSISNISLGKADDNYSVRVSYTNQNQTGISPFTSLRKNQFSTQTSVNLSKLITVGANINYASTFTHGNFDDGYANQTTGSFSSWFHRDLDMGIMKDMAFFKSPEGRLVSWNKFDPGNTAGAGDKSYRGFYWFNHYAFAGLTDYNTYRNRLFGDLNIRFNISKKFYVSAFYQKQEVNVESENKRPSILANSFYNELRPNTDYPGYDSYATGITFQKEDNLQALAVYNDKFMDDQLTINVNAGGNVRMEKSQQISANTNLGLTIPDLFTLSNSKSALQYANVRSQKEVRSVFASGSFGYKQFLYLSWSARNDWSSALNPKNNSYFYPSAGIGFVFSELLHGSFPIMSYGKLRGNIAQIGSDLAAYGTTFTYTLGQNQFNGNAVSNTPDTRIDPNIKPSLSTNYEFGADFKFLENRIGFGVTYYNNDRKDQILTVPITPASGFTGLTTNVAEAVSKGIELSLDATPVKTGDFKWDLTVNWAHNESKIIKLAPGISNIYGGARDAFAVASLTHVEGGTWGQLRGRAIARDASGTPIVTSSGVYSSVTNHDFGSVLPSFTGGFQNYFTYKNFKLAVNVDFQSGGKYFSLSDYWGTFSGLTARTAQLNDKGVSQRAGISDGGGVHVKGVAYSGTDAQGAPVSDGTAVDMYVDAKTYYDQWGNGTIAENSLYDMTFVKLREMSLSYNIPVSKLGNVSKVFKTASISLIGRNLWLIYTPNRDFDPSIMSNLTGENGQLPGTRSFGASIKLGL
ncbi:SusC/RagA family TonB-linked outer membrane protein [Cytophagales bacterium WSM2-2]|nr:SusC/RagA family TonB-linked outer membrane protein [Cytophagales bacterium WSM2-2]